MKSQKFKPFIAVVRGEVWHIKSPSVGSVKRLFVCDLKGHPTESEVEVFVDDSQKSRSKA